MSFFAESGCISARHTDFHDRRLGRQRRMRLLVVVLVTALCTWVVVESARAISLF